MEILAILALAAVLFGGSSSSSSSTDGVVPSWTLTIGPATATLRRAAVGWSFESASASGSASSLHAAIVAVAGELGDFTSELTLRRSDDVYYGAIIPSAARTSEGLPLSFGWSLRVGLPGGLQEPIEFIGDAQFRATALGELMQQLQLELPTSEE